ncbi:biotin--protein ligase isoform X1 [Gadus morhua]|uniref:Holocarboxylase synthetase n=2 Tax=Gadus morhua TaxID=8049 RepID=A0A8C5A561_GADMO|nr:biotin--protein ligase isoform X1 [Gadus morhua]
MLITLCYVYLWVRCQKCYSVVIKKTLRRRLAENRSISFTFSVLNPERPPTCYDQAVHTQPTNDNGLHTHQKSSPPEETILLKLRNKAVYITEHQVCLDLTRWTLLGSAMVGGQRIEDVSFIVEGPLGKDVVQPPPQTSNKKVLKWSDYCIPLACSPGPPFKAVAQATLDNFSRLGVAFMEDRLRLDNGLMPSKIVSVILQESNINTLFEKLRSNSPLSANSLISESCKRLAEDQQKPCRKGSLLLDPEARRRLDDRRGSEPLCSSLGQGSLVREEGRSSRNTEHMEGHGHHLHLSSCNECLELENSTILSVKFASAENIPNLPDDDGDDSSCVDGGVGTLAEFEDDAGGLPSLNGLVGGKPPNVLVFTAGCQERFHRIHQLLTECVDTDGSVVYHLRPEQVLSEPWLESTKLLVLAEEEPLSPQLQARFLSYLDQGGRVLGLSSTLCPAGLSLDRPTRHSGKRAKTLSFTREDSTELELSVLPSGSVFVRDVVGGGEVELWGELKGAVSQGRTDMVIIRITHGDDGGEAVLCQVHLELAPNCEAVASECYDKLKVSNARRYEVLTEILTSLGLNCELNQAPVSSPIYLLSTSLASEASFLKTLQSSVDKDSYLRLPKVSLKVVSSAEPDGLVLEAGCLALVTRPPEPPSWDHFSLDTYKSHLRTRTLGRTVLYADVTPTTMDLLEGMVVNLPENVGLIAVAGRQSHGRGRGGNTWLSPLGCAMFTLHVKVALGSRLGQRIPFLQHLAALAVVEAVCTLPGYQDIDLRVKWPNDIYYSNKIKLGGVLVTSTLMGSDFHLLIGCGFNVSNSNPTICLNDLVALHNREHGTSLAPLSISLLIARSVSTLEALIADVQEKGPDAALPTYYKRWMHSGTRVRLWSADGPEAEVVGLDDNGFLQVYSKEQGVVSVEPDGNSFDMLMNLVVSKQH